MDGLENGQIRVAVSSGHQQAADILRIMMYHERITTCHAQILHVSRFLSRRITTYHAYAVS
jgi:hypothetical protein